MVVTQNRTMVRMKKQICIMTGDPVRSIEHFEKTDCYERLGRVLCCWIQEHNIQINLHTTLSDHHIHTT
jgi:hypothetical protein